MLGALIELTQLIKQESIMKVLDIRIPAPFLDLNKQALELGQKIAENFDLKNI
jgi:2-oxoglutarate ferredoxin oxidoreductase subunit gamma